jgi:hypothetical protein
MFEFFFATVMIPVSSSVFRAIGWNDGTLIVEFHSGRTYDHHGVPDSVFEELMQAPSKGTFYNRYIRGRYR